MVGMMGKGIAPVVNPKKPSALSKLATKAAATAKQIKPKSESNDAATNTTDSSKDSLALFNDQMYLLDMFAQGSKKFGGIKAGSAQVPVSTPFQQNINKLVIILFCIFH